MRTEGIVKSRAVRRLIRKPVHAIWTSLFGTVSHVHTDELVAALTFDDGPHPEWTPLLLDILDRHEARATFFCLGRLAQEHPNIVAAAAEAGHTIGNHTWDHPCLPLISSRDRRTQILRCGEALSLHGLKLLRPPYGYQSWSSRLDAWRLGYEVIGWNVFAEDWLDRSADHIADLLRRGIRPGCIVALHDRIFSAPRSRYFDRGPMLEALDQVLSELRGSYRFVSMSELLSHGSGAREVGIRKPDINWLNTLLEEDGRGRRYGSDRGR